MENNNEKNTFRYSYTAPTEKERKEVESLRRQYAAEEGGDKIEQLKKLDKQVKDPPKILALSLGIVGTLIFGGGLAMTLEWGWIVLGCIVSAVGIVPLALAYPMYKKLLNKLKKKHREEILKLSEEILNG